MPALGTAANYRHTYTHSSQDIIAKSEIYLSVVKPEEANGEAFNTADHDTAASYVEKWPLIVDYFGLKGVGPVEPAESEVLWPSKSEKELTFSSSIFPRGQVLGRSPRRV